MANRPNSTSDSLRGNKSSEGVLLNGNTEKGEALEMARALFRKRE